MKASLQFFLTISALCATGFSQDPPASKTQPGENAKAAAANEKRTPTQLRAEKIRMPKIDFRETTVRAAIEFLSLKSRQFDPEGKGINVILMLETPREQQGVPLPPPGLPQDPVLTLSLNDVPASQVLLYITNLTGLSLRWDEDAAFVSTLTDPAVKAQPNAVVVPPKPRPELKNNGGEAGEKVLARCAAIRVPKIDFRESTPRAAIDFLNQKFGAGIVLKAPAAPPVPPPPGEPGDNEKLTLSANDIPLLELLRYIAELSGLEASIAPNGSFELNRVAPAK